MAGLGFWWRKNCSRCPVGRPMHSSCKCTGEGKVKNFNGSLVGGPFSRPLVQSFCYVPEQSSVILRKLMPPGQYGRKRPPSFSLLPGCQGECGLHKEARESCPLQLPEPGLFRTVIKHQSLPQLWWQLAQTRHKRLARGGGRLVLKPGQHQNRLVRSLQLGSAAWPPAAQTRSASTPQRGFCRQQAAAAGPYRYARATGLSPVVPALPPAAAVGAAQMAMACISRLCGSVDPAVDALPLMRMV